MRPTTPAHLCNFLSVTPQRAVAAPRLVCKESAKKILVSSWNLPRIAFVGKCFGLGQSDNACDLVCQRISVEWLTVEKSPTKQKKGCWDQCVFFPLRLFCVFRALLLALFPGAYTSIKHANRDQPFEVDRKCIQGTQC